MKEDPMNKVKEFFENKKVIVTEGVIIAAAATGLIIGGVSLDNIAKIPVVALGVVNAVEAVITIIQGLFKK